VPAVEERVEGDIGYIRIGPFSEQTHACARIEKTTSEIGADKLKGYIIDLRNNRGGLPRPGCPGLRRLPRSRRDRLDPRPQCRGDSGSSTPSRAT
jgi:hypothetical protein